jgi:hypothetical protein
MDQDVVRYDVRTVPWDHGLELHISQDGKPAGVTRTHRGDGTTAAAMVKNYLEVTTGTQIPDDAEIRISYKSGDVR